MHSITIFAAKYLVFLLPLLLLYILLKMKRHQQVQLVVQVVLAGILAFGLSRVATHLVASPRPFIADGVTPFFSASRDNGFPSDHTLLAALVAFTTLLYSRRLGYVALVLAVLVGVARVAAGVHHAIDVYGALFLSGLSVLVVKLLASRYNQRSSQSTARNHHD